MILDRDDAITEAVITARYWREVCGMSPMDVFNALDRQPYRKWPTWDDATWAIARTAHELPRLPETVVIELPPVAA